MNRTLRPGMLIGAKYRLTRLLGQGGMGSVFAAENMLTGKQVAIKAMHRDLASDPDAANRFLREAKASSRIRHPNVVDVYDVLSVDGTFLLIMEMLEGQPLSEFLATQTVPLPRLLNLLLGAMRGVAAAHRQGVIHRDVKPENVFLSLEGDDEQVVPKVLDFGISKIQGAQEIALTAPGSALGTILYMATEQLDGAANADARSDIYAFGVILYEAITGQLPFYAETISALALLIVEGKPTPIRQLRPDVSPKLAQLIGRAMAKRRDDRWPSMEALIAALEPFTDESKHSNTLTRTSKRAWSTRPQSRVIPERPRAREPASKVAAPSTQTPFVANVTNSEHAREKTWLAVVLIALLGVAAYSLLRSLREPLTKRRTTNVSAATQAPPPPSATVTPPLNDNPISPPRLLVSPVVTTPPSAAQPVATPITPVQPASSRPLTTQRAHPVTIATPTSSDAREKSGAVSPSPPAAKRPSCNPNFFFDAQGDKHFKPECF